MENVIILEQDVQGSLLASIPPEQTSTLSYWRENNLADNSPLHQKWKTFLAFLKELMDMN